MNEDNLSDSKLISHIKLEPDTRHNISIYSDLTAAADSVVKLEKFTFKREKKLGLQYKQTNSLKVVNEVDGFQRSDSSVDLKRNAFAVKQEADASPLKRSRWEPAHWLEQYARIKEMRSGLTAPVDTCGCDSIARFDPTLSEKNKRYHVLVSLMLSAQTKDETTAKAMIELQKIPLNVDNFLATDDQALEKMIYPVSFYRRKVQFIKKTSQILQEKYNSDIPDNVQDLMKLPGVGPKMAYLVMSSAWNLSVGIGVDTHVHRIANRLGWTRTKTKLPENTRKELEDWLPSAYWTEVNHLLVGFGQEMCRPIGPKCGVCLCKDICPVGKTFQEKKPRAKKSSKQLELPNDK